MSNSGNNKKRASDDSSSWEVDDLLRAAEDHLLLNLRTNSHSKSQIPSSSSSYLDSDLGRRFDALKSPPIPVPNPTPSKPPEQPQEKRIAAAAADEESSGILGDDLASRFAALKASSGPAAAANLGFEQKTDGGRIFEVSDDGDVDGDRDGDGVSKKEVEKLVQWAKDAARLDPSPKSDDDDDDSLESEDDSEEEERMKRKGKSKPKPKRFIFF